MDVGSREVVEVFGRGVKGVIRLVLYVLWLVSLVYLSLAIYALTPKLIDEIPGSAKHLVAIGALVLAIFWYVLWWLRGIGKASRPVPP